MTPLKRHSYKVLVRVPVVIYLHEERLVKRGMWHWKTSGMCFVPVELYAVL